MIDLTATYPGQVVTSDPQFPYGKPRNVTVPGDGTGTPWEERLVQDWVGAWSDLMVRAGITPSNVSDEVGTSDFNDALETLYVNGLTGGSYAPTGPITIAGAGLIVGGTGLIVSAGAAFTADVSIAGELDITNAGTLAVHGTSEFFGDVVFGSTCDVTFRDEVTFEDEATFEDIASFEDTVTVDANLLCSGVLWSTGTSTFEGQMSMKDEIYLNGEGRVRKRVATAGDANESHGVLECDVLFIPVSGITGSHNYTIPDAGASIGSTMLVVNGNATYNQTLKSSGGATILTLDAGNTALLVWLDAGTEQWIPVYEV